MSPEQMAKELGITPCECSGECSFCEAEDARIWCKGGYTLDGWETDYYVCEECLPTRYQEHVDEMESWENFDFDEWANYHEKDWGGDQ